MPSWPVDASRWRRLCVLMLSPFQCDRPLKGRGFCLATSSVERLCCPPLKFKPLPSAPCCTCASERQLVSVSRVEARSAPNASCGSSPLDCNLASPPDVCRSLEGLLQSIGWSPANSSHRWGCGPAHADGDSACGRRRIGRRSGHSDGDFNSRWQSHRVEIGAGCPAFWIGS